MGFPWVHSQVAMAQKHVQKWHLGKWNQGLLGVNRCAMANWFELVWRLRRGVSFTLYKNLGYNPKSRFFFGLTASG